MLRFPRHGHLRSARLRYAAARKSNVLRGRRAIFYVAIGTAHDTINL
jgi:hypothetical protein